MMSRKRKRSRSRMMRRRKRKSGAGKGVAREIGAGVKEGKEVGGVGEDVNGGEQAKAEEE